MLIFVALFSTVCDADDADTKVHVNITNDLTGNSSLAVHCRTRIRDLGDHKIPHGSSLVFIFDQNFITKRLDCNVHWDQAVASLHTIKIETNTGAAPDFVFGG